MVLALVRDHVEVGKIDCGDDQRDERIASVVLRVGKDRDVRLDECHFFVESVFASLLNKGVQHTNIAGHIAVQAREDHIAVLEFFCRTAPDDEVTELL